MWCGFTSFIFFENTSIRNDKDLGYTISLRCQKGAWAITVVSIMFSEYTLFKARNFSRGLRHICRKIFWRRLRLGAGDGLQHNNSEVKRNEKNMRRYSTGALQIFLKFLSSNNRPSQCDEFRYDATMLVTLYTHRQDSSVPPNTQHKPFMQ